MKKIKDNKKVLGIFLKLFLFLFLIILLLTLSTCKNIKPLSKETTPDLSVTNTSFSTETKLLSEWVADGIISINEYDKSQVFSPDFTLYWRSDQQFIYFALKSHANGWVTLGFQPNPENRKKNADFVLATVTQE
ncbi:MAG: hypothetical protein M1365_13145, partial [Actinobacteria bacterium]|nr:hypothetical protein [Actinomycetota bacterium]